MVWEGKMSEEITVDGREGLQSKGRWDGRKQAGQDRTKECTEESKGWTAVCLA